MGGIIQCVFRPVAVSCHVSFGTGAACQYCRRRMRGCCRDCICNRVSSVLVAMILVCYHRVPAIRKLLSEHLPPCEDPATSLISRLCRQPILLDELHPS